MNLIEIKAAIPAEAADAAEQTLLELGAENWSVLEDALTGRAWVVGVFPAEAEARAAWAGLRDKIPAGEPGIRLLANADWRDSYKAHFRAWQFGRLHWVPVWERESFRPPPGDAVLWLDPGLAFGTGNHETTRLCCEQLVARAENGKLDRPVIDAGCGSGILALSAARLGFAEVAGFDNDPEAVRVSGENAALNGLGPEVSFFLADLTAGLAGRQAGLVLANIQADVLQRFARELAGAVAPGGQLVLSGILAHELDSVRAAFAAAAPGWLFRSRVLGEWACLVLDRPATG